MEGKKKIIFLDDWSQSFNHIVRKMVDILGTENITYKFIHMDSINNRGKAIIYKNIDGIEVRDVKTYSKMYNIIKVLMLEKPDLVIVFDKGSLTQRAFVHACKKLHIKSIQLQHGLLITSEDNSNLTKSDKKRGLNFYVHSISKVAISVFIYISTCLKEDPLFFLKRNGANYLFTFFTNYKRFFHDKRNDIQCDKVFCFSEKDKNTLVNCDAYSPEAVKVVGNYFMEDVLTYLDKPLGDLKMEFCRENDFSENCEIITLVSQALGEDNWEDFKDEKICKFLEDIYYAILKNENRYLVVKLHPRENLNKYNRIISDYEISKQVRFVKSGDMNALMRVSDIILGFFSAALMNAMILNRPVYIIKWLTNQEFPIDYSKLRMSEELKSLMELKELIDSLKAQSRTPKDTSQSFYIGPPFSRNMFKKEVMELL